MRRRVLGLAVVVAALAAGCSGEGGFGSPYSVLDEPQTDEDELPPAVRPHAHVDESSSWLIGEYEEYTYWLAMNEDGQVCTVMTEGSAWHSTGCGGGIGKHTHGSEHMIAHLIPDGYEATEEQDRDWTFVGPNLAIEPRG